MTTKIVGYKGIEITVSNNHSTSFSVYFRNLPGNFEPLQNVNALRGHSTIDSATEAGKKFVDDHQWKLVETIGIFSVFVRLWWDGDWGYSVRTAGSSANLANYKSRKDALTAGITYAQEKITEYEVM